MTSRRKLRIAPNGERLVLVSGATGGIGGAICDRLLAGEFRVVMLGRHPGRLDQALKSRCQQNADRLSVQAIDLSDARAIDSALKCIEAKLGAVTDLVHAAGDGPVGTLLETTDAMWDTNVQGKLLGTVRLTRAVAVGMVERQQGRIVIVNGVFSQQPDPLFPINSLINCGLAGFAKAISHDLGRHGVCVNSVNPGVTLTPLWNQICRELALRFQQKPADIERLTFEKIPLGHPASPSEIAAAVAFLLSPDADHINGAVINVDGGATSAV